MNKPFSRLSIESIARMMRGFIQSTVIQDEGIQRRRFSCKRFEEDYIHKRNRMPLFIYVFFLQGAKEYPERKRKETLRLINGLLFH